MVDLTFALRVLRALDGQRQATIWAKLAARILLPSLKMPSALVCFHFPDSARSVTFCQDKRPLEMDPDWRLESEGVMKMKPPARDNENSRETEPCQQHRTWLRVVLRLPSSTRSCDGTGRVQKTSSH
jgi:hypothetical protein